MPATLLRRRSSFCPTALPSVPETARRAPRAPFVNAPTTIALSPVHVGEESERLVLDVLRSGHLAQGPMVARLESTFATLCGVQHAVAVTNGTVALVAAMQVLELEPGDEVVTSPFTFVATLNAILECGAVARFADIDPRTFTVDAAA